MKKIIAKRSLIGMGASFIIGMILIFSSPTIGQKIGYHALTSGGGMMNTSEYEMVIKSNTDSFRVGGLVLSLIGGLGSLASGYVLYNEIDKDTQKQ